MRNLATSHVPPRTLERSLTGGAATGDSSAYVVSSLNRTASEWPLKIPMEIFLTILLECDVLTIVTCRLVCRKFDHFIVHQRALLYRMALVLEGQVDCSGGASGANSITSAQKLQRLLRQSLAWRGELMPGLVKAIPVTRSDSIYELNGGIFALGEICAPNGNVWQPAALSSGNNCLDFVKLPSLVSGEKQAHWGHIEIGHDLEIVDFTFNVELDLLVLIEQKRLETETGCNPYRLHFFALSQAEVALEPHPLAQKPCVEYECPKEWCEYQLVFGMYGDHLGLMLFSGQVADFDRLIVWDWKKGTRAVKKGDPDILESFVFISEGFVLIPNLEHGTLDISRYTLSEETGTFETILMLNLPRPSDGLDYVYILSRTQPSGQPTANDVRANNSPSRNTNGPADTQPSEDQDEPRRPSGLLDSSSTLFTPSIDDAIIAISLRVGPISDAPDNPLNSMTLPDSDGTIMIKRSMINDLIDYWEDEQKARAKKVKPQDGPQSRLSEVLWKQWMYSSRWIRNMDSPRWVRDVHGMRVATRILDTPDALVHHASPLSTPAMPIQAYPPLVFPFAPSSSDNTHQSTGPTLPTLSSLLMSASILNPTLPSIQSVVTSTAGQIPTHPPTLLPLGPWLASPGPSNQTPPAATPLINSIPAQPQLTGNGGGMAGSPRYRTRIYDFNQLPSIRVRGAIPYPRDIEIDLRSSDERAGPSSSSPFDIDPSSEYATIHPNASREQMSMWENNARIRRVRHKNAPKADRGWDVIGREKGLQWTRKPVLQDTVIPPGVTFAEEIVTSLPYLEITSTTLNDSTALMMDAERIIGMKTDEAYNLTCLEVLVM